MEMEKVIGMTGVKTEMNSLVEHADAYTKGGANVPNFYITLDAGNGQTFATEAITDLLVSHRLREFHGLDDFLEYRTDGTLPNIKWIFADIDDNAVYDIGYKGVVAIDVTKLANNQNGYEMKYFEDNLAMVSKTATIILFCSKSMGLKGDKLRERLREVIGRDRVKVIEEYEYSSSDYAQMVVQNIKERGIEVPNEEKVIKVLSEVVTDKEVKNAKSAVALAEQLVFYADYSRIIPVLDFGEAKNFKDSFCKEA